MPKRAALDAFLAHKAAIDTMIAELKALSDDHFGCSPDEVTWAEAGTVEHYASVLRQITDSAFQRGEYAKG